MDAQFVRPHARQEGEFGAYGVGAPGRDFQLAVGDGFGFELVEVGQDVFAQDLGIGAAGVEEGLALDDDEVGQRVRQDVRGFGVGERGAAAQVSGGLAFGAAVGPEGRDQAQAAQVVAGVEADGVAPAGKHGQGKAGDGQRGGVGEERDERRGGIEQVFLGQFNERYQPQAGARGDGVFQRQSGPQGGAVPSSGGQRPRQAEERQIQAGMLDGVGEVFEVGVDEGFAQRVVFGVVDQDDEELDGQDVGDGEVRAPEQGEFEREGQGPDAEVRAQRGRGPAPRGDGARHEQSFDGPGERQSYQVRRQQRDPEGFNHRSPAFSVSSRIPRGG